MTSANDDTPKPSAEHDAAPAKTAAQRDKQAEAAPEEAIAAPGEESGAPTEPEDSPETEARPGPGPAPTPPAPPPPRHPLARKTFWLALSALALMVGGAAVAATPFFAADALLGWTAGAFALATLFLFIEAFATPRWGGTTWRLIQAVALGGGAAMIGFGKLDPWLAPPLIVVGALGLFGAAGFLGGLFVIRSKGAVMMMLGGLAAIGAAAGVMFAPAEQAPMLPAAATGGALIVTGLTTFALALRARAA